MPGKQKIYTHHLGVHVSEAFYRDLKLKSKLAGYRSVSQFARDLLVTRRIVVLEQEDIKDLNCVMSGIANNINQIAMKYHATNHLSNKHLIELTKVLSSLRDRFHEYNKLILELAKNIPDELLDKISASDAVDST